MDHFESWKDLLDPMFYIRLGGLWVVLCIIFSETGLFVGFFLPGDSLLFVSGIYAREIIRQSLGGTGNDFLDTSVLAGLVASAAILGNMVGFWFGKKGGPLLYQRRDSLLFKKEHLLKAHNFYERHGGSAIIIARFLPLIRTFAPIVAGIVCMKRSKFMFYNLIGAVAWSFTMIYAGHYLNTLFAKEFGIDLKSNLEVIIVSIVVVTTTPVIIKVFFRKGKRKKLERERPIRSQKEYREKQP